MSQKELELEPSPVRHQPPRLVHYLGAKHRLLEPIRAELFACSTGGGVFLDLFSGSGIVAGHLGHYRRIIAVDIQEYARVLASAYLSQAPVDASYGRRLVAESSTFRKTLRRLKFAFGPMLQLEQRALEAAAASDFEPLAALSGFGSLEYATRHRDREAEPQAEAATADVQSRLVAEGLERSAETVLTRYYGGLFFPVAVAIQLDALLEAMSEVDGRRKDITLAAMLGAASSVSLSVGNQFAQPPRPYSRSGKASSALARRYRTALSRTPVELFLSALGELARFLPSARSGASVRGDVLAFLESPPDSVAAVYADPPYTRDHYSRFYHVLETICLRDEPGITASNIGNAPSRGAYREKRFQSGFCIRSQAPTQFAALFERCSALAPLVLSYSPHEGTGSGHHPRVMTLLDLKALASEYYSDVRIREIEEVKHSRFNSDDLALGERAVAEVLLVCR